MSSPLDLNSPLPLYAQLKERLHGWIEHGLATGTLEPDTQIPTEHELCECYQVSRITVKRALNELAAGGVIYTRQGKGTFISGAKIAHDLGLHSYTAMMQSVGIAPTSQVLEAKIIEPSAKVAQFLELDKGMLVAKLVRVRLGESEPLSISTSYLPDHLVPNLFEQDLTASLFTLLQQFYGYHLVRISESIEPVRLSASENEIFSTSADTLGLLTQGVVRIKNETPIEYNKSIIRGDKGCFSIEHQL